MSVRWSQRRSWIRVNLWVHTLGPLNVPIHSEAVIEVSESDFDLETLNGLWSGSPHSKDLTRAPRGSLVFGFTSLAHTRSCARKLLGFKVATPPPPPPYTHTGSYSLYWGGSRILWEGRGSCCDQSFTNKQQTWQELTTTDTMIQ